MSPRRETILRLYLPLAILIGLFLLVVLQRRQIRSHWWAFRLARTEDTIARGYYLSCLAATGEPATEAIRRLATDHRADVRALSVFALQRLPAGSGIRDLARLMRDEEWSVREAAASGLAFMGTNAAVEALRETLAQPEEAPAAAAAAALGRADDRLSCESLKKAAGGHPSALVRAQAIESLAGLLRDSVAPSARTFAAQGTCDPLTILIGALRDHGLFEGPLALERQIAAAAARLGASQPSGCDSPRTVAQLSAHILRELGALPETHATPVTEDDLRSLVEECRRRLIARSSSGS